MSRLLDGIDAGDAWLAIIGMGYVGLPLAIEFAVLADADGVIICVPTPLSKTKDPDISYIVAACDEIARYAHPDMLVVLESTTYPGSTEELISRD